MNIHVHHVSSKCDNAILSAFMYWLGNILISYKEMWQLTIIISQKKKNIFYFKQDMPFFTFLLLSILRTRSEK